MTFCVTPLTGSLGFLMGNLIPKVMKSKRILFILALFITAATVSCSPEEILEEEQEAKEAELYLHSLEGAEEDIEIQ